MATIDLRRILGRRLTLTGSTLRAAIASRRRARSRRRSVREVWPLVEARRRAADRIAATFPLADAAAAHRLMESSAHVGKIVLVP